MLYDIRTSEKAATTLETLTGVNRTIWLAEQYKNYGRIDYTSLLFILGRNCSAYSG